MQGNDDKYLKVSACLKHLIAYSTEDGPPTRMQFSDVVTAQDMTDTYQVPFQAGVQQGKVSCLMCSYNAEAMAGGKAWGYGVEGPGSAYDHGGIPSCANRYLLNDLARMKWKFRGYITSDCWAVQNVGGNCDEKFPAGCGNSSARNLKGHNYTHTRAATMNATLGAGMDKDCSGFLDNNTVVDSVEHHGVNEEVVNDALRHSISVTFRLGAADPPNLNPFNAR